MKHPPIVTPKPELGREAYDAIVARNVDLALRSAYQQARAQAEQLAANPPPPRAPGEGQVPAETFGPKKR